MSELVCKGCGSKYIQNKTLCLCSECVYKKGHNGKSRQQVAIEKQISKPIKKSTYQYKRKDTGERELFLEIWDERLHVCENCKRSLGDLPKTWMFSHRIAKSVDNKKRLDKKYIDLLCYECHYDRDFRGEECYKRRSVY